MNENFCSECKITQSVVFSTIQLCANTVFQLLGYGLSESVYQNALAALIRKEFDGKLKCSHALKSVSDETVIPIICDSRLCGTLRSDVILYWKVENQQQNDIVIELKATSTPLDEKSLLQLVAYLRATNAKKGILINFTQKSAILTAAWHEEKQKKKRKLNEEPCREKTISISLDHLLIEPRVEFFPVLLN